MGWMGLDLWAVIIKKINQNTERWEFTANSNGRKHLPCLLAWQVNQRSAFCKKREDFSDQLTVGHNLFADSEIETYSWGFSMLPKTNQTSQL